MGRQPSDGLTAPNAYVSQLAKQNPSKSGYLIKPNMRFDFTRLGLGVPAVLVSPWIAKGVVDSTLYQHTSILATLRDIFGVGSLTKRDAAANSFASQLGKLTTARTDAPATLTRPALPVANAADMRLPPTDRLKDLWVGATLSAAFTGKHCAVAGASLLPLAQNCRDGEQHAGLSRSSFASQLGKLTARTDAPATLTRPALPVANAADMQLPPGQTGWKGSVAPVGPARWTSGLGQGNRPTRSARGSGGLYRGGHLAAHEEFHREQRRRARYHIEADGKGGFGWSFYDDKGNVIATSTKRVFNTGTHAQADIERMRDLAPFARQTK